MNPRIQERKDGVTRHEMNELAENAGWGANYYENEGKWQYMLARTAHIAYIKIDGRLAAFGRVNEDGKMCMFYDIGVHSDFRGKNLGRLIMEHLVKKVQDKKFASIGLFAWDGNKTVPEFYKKFGFEESRGMELKKFMSGH